MSLQIINSIQGKPEFVLLPISAYEKLSMKLKQELATEDSEYVPFILEDYIENPVALARMKKHVSQQKLAEAMKVSQAYISQLEARKKVSAKMLAKIHVALEEIK